MVIHRQQEHHREIKKMKKVIRIDDREVMFKATALTPRIYRKIIGRDMISDMNKLSKSLKKVQEAKENNEDISFSSEDLIIFEDTAFIMALQADANIEQKTPDEWLDTFDMFSIYEVLPQLLALWGDNQKTTSIPKKK